MRGAGDSITRQSELDPAKAQAALTEAKGCVDAVSPTNRDAYREASDRADLRPRRWSSSLTPEHHH